MFKIGDLVDYKDRVYKIIDYSEPIDNFKKYQIFNQELGDDWVFPHEIELVKREALEHKLKVGDRVRHDEYGEGTIVVQKSDTLSLVGFDNEMGGHSGCWLDDPQGKHGHYWWVESKELSLFEQGFMFEVNQKIKEIAQEQGVSLESALNIFREKTLNSDTEEGTIKPLNASYDEFIKEQVRIYLNKNKDYGDSFTELVREHGEVAINIFAQTKTKRIEQLLESESAVDESIEDSIRDLFNYIAMYQYEKWNESVGIGNLINHMERMLSEDSHFLQLLLEYAKIDYPLAYEIEERLHGLCMR